MLFVLLRSRGRGETTAAGAGGTARAEQELLVLVPWGWQERRGSSLSSEHAVVVASSRRQHKSEDARSIVAQSLVMRVVLQLGGTNAATVSGRRSGRCCSVAI
jgi:hypothetical protein